VLLVRAGPVRNGDLFEITFSSDNSINSTGFYATYHVINASMMTSSPDQPGTGKRKRGGVVTFNQSIIGLLKRLTNRSR